MNFLPACAHPPEHRNSTPRPRRPLRLRPSTEAPVGSCVPELIFEGEIRDREGMKALRPDVRIQGFDVFVLEFTRALFQHGAARQIHFTREAGAQFMRSAPPWLLSNASRCQFHSAFDIPGFAAIDKAV